MGLLSFFTNAELKDSDLPWYNRPSIFQHITINTTNTGKLSDTGQVLPDEDLLHGDEQLKWAAGAMDGTFGHHGQLGSAKKRAKKVARLLKSIATNGSIEKKIALYEILADDTIIDYLDASLEILSSSSVPVEPYLHDFARWLTFQSPDRGAVKYGIALLGLIADPEDMPSIKMLGRHEEFTLFAVVAVMNTYNEPDKQLLDMAQYVDGWGKIHIVERLAETQDIEIKNWLLLEGYKNSVMNEYLAFTSATAGDLLASLKSGSISDALLNSAADIIEALIYGGPAQDINDYDDAAEVIHLYVTELDTRKDLGIAHFNTLKVIEDYLQNEDTDRSEDEHSAWTVNQREVVLNRLNRITSKESWRSLVISKLSSNDDYELWDIKRAAEALQIDIWPTVWDRINKEPKNGPLWMMAMQKVEEKNIENLIRLAESTIPLKDIASGPADELGLSEEFMYHQILDTIVQNLDRFPGRGANLLTASIQSPVVRNRTMAIRAIQEWGNQYHSDELLSILKHAEKIEPNADVKADILFLLESW